MFFRARFCRFAVLAACLASAVVTSKAILFYSTADPSHNTSPPTGTLANSGWQFEGLWLIYLGTPIAPQYFVTAKHVGGEVGNPFWLDGVPYTTVAYFDDPMTDLRIWRIQGMFPRWAPMFSSSDEVGQNVVVIGRGTQRGDPVYGAGKQAVLKGWLPGASDGVERWGENRVDSIEIGDAQSAYPGGEFLKCNFDAQGLSDEADLTAGDSGGAVFIQSAGVWKLAGINYAVDGQFNTEATGPGFAASIFDAGGLYYGSEQKWTFVPENVVDQPTGFYASRISARLSWIQSVLSTPVPPVLESSASPTGPFQPVASATLDPATQTFRTPSPDHNQFYRISSGSSLRITAIKLTSGQISIRYQ